MKKILVVFLILLIVAVVIITYLNKVILPVKIKSLIVSSLKEVTQKEVNLENLEFSIFKGLVLRNLILSDATKTLLKVKEVSCAFLILPLFFKKKVIIPSLNVNGAEIFLQRKYDNTFNLTDLFHPQGAKPSKTGFGILVSKVAIKNSHLNFQDDTLSPAFTKNIENLNLIVYLSLPAQLRFNLRAEIPTSYQIKIDASGEFKIPERQLVAQIGIKDFVPCEFLAYYQNRGFLIPQGSIDGLIKLNFKDYILDIDLETQNQDLVLHKDKIVLRLNSDTQARLRWDLKEKKLEFQGKADIVKSDISGLGPLGDITEVNGRIKFDNSAISTDKLNAKVLGIPLEAKVTLSDFSRPSVQLALFSKDLSLESGFLFRDKLLTISRLSGKYFNSGFSLIRGIIDMQDPSKFEVDLESELTLNLEDLKVFLKKFQSALEKINLAGITDARFKIKGNLKDFKSCVADMTLASPAVSAYGLRATDFSLNYSQIEGLANISQMRLSLYDGMIEAEAKMNLNSENLSYWLSTNIQGIKIEKLKLDTSAKEKDIAGTITAAAKINGFSGDLSKLNGEGEISISAGKLWQLNLFKGLGELLFTQDFANIIFSEGDCGFIIQDKYIYTNNLKLKSNWVSLYGPCKLGFDGSINAAINIEVLDELVPISNTLKDVTTVILGQIGKFGVIKITGTLKKPKYKFQPLVTDIIEGLKDMIFGKPE